LASEDCLFLNVYSPVGAKNLPILVYIHGGGYGVGNAPNQDLSSMLAANNNSFVGVTIQYRLGAFGFLSSDEVFRMGAVNAGLLDQTFALQWVQQYIGLFGGNSSQVTIAGESAGAGSVMLQTMAYGGTLGTSLFTNVIAASVYLPQQYGYRDYQPSQSYYSFASWAGCMPNQAYGGSNMSIMDCLRAANTTTLQYASFNVSMSGRYGSWGFLPVTDGVFIQQQPSQQLLEKRLNGKHMLVGNNASKDQVTILSASGLALTYLFQTKRRRIRNQTSPLKQILLRGFVSLSHFSATTTLRKFSSTTQAPTQASIPPIPRLRLWANLALQRSISALLRPGSNSARTYVLLVFQPFNSFSSLTCLSRTSTQKQPSLVQATGSVRASQIEAAVHTDTNTLSRQANTPLILPPTSVRQG